MSRTKVTRSSLTRTHKSPAPPSWPVIVAQSATVLSGTSATITWSLDDPSSGYVEYGTTTAYGSETSHDASLLAQHSKTITGLTPGTTYHYRIRATNSQGNETIGPDSTFLTVTATTMYAATVYGPGVAVDSRANLPIDNRDLSFRFIASVSANLTSVALLWRWWDQHGYSLGNGGSYEVSVQTDDGTSNHRPSGTKLASTTFTPSATELALNDTRHHQHTFPSPPAVTAGTLYHIVVHNTSSSPASNWTSINMGIRALGSTYGGTSPRGTAQPAYTDDLATLYQYNGSTYQVMSESPVLNIAYSDGSHDGNSYIISGCGTGAISFGGTTMVRQRFNIGQTVTATGIGVRPKKLSGTGALTVDLRTSTASIESVAIPAASFATLATGCNDNGQQWLEASFLSSHVLVAGTALEVRMSAPTANTYRHEAPLRTEDAGGTGTLMASGAHWNDRLANPEVSTNSGSTWSVIYSGQTNDMPFYLLLA